jgi:hypothetical protein
MKLFLVTLLCLLNCLGVYAQRAHSTGDNTTEEEFSRIKKVAIRATRDVTALPASFSLKQYAPPVKNQDPYGTCVAWSTAYAARTISYAVRNNFTSTDSIIKYSFSPGHLYSKIKFPKDDACKIGSSIYTALENMKGTGILPYHQSVNDCQPFVASNTLSETAQRFRIKGYQTYSDYKQLSLNTINPAKKTLLEKKPLLLSLKCFPSFFKVDKDGFWTPDPNETKFSGHAMCIVGYDDTKGGGAFEVMNSWGTEWGNKGFFWLTYDQLIKYGNYIVEMVDYEGSSAPPSQNIDIPKNVIDKPTPEKPIEIPKIEKPVKPLLQLSGNIEFVTLDGSTMPVKRTKITTRSITVEDDEQAEYSQYKLVENYPGGTAFKIKFTTTAPAYVYIFSEDDKQVISRLFPYSPAISAAINSNNATVYFPSESKHARLSNTPGVENICVLYSKNEINFEEFLQKVQKEKTPLTMAIKTEFAKNLIELKKVQFANDTIGFKAPADEDKMICFFIKLEHN